jgi:hypothetical protein
MPVDDKVSPKESRVPRNLPFSSVQVASNQSFRLLIPLFAIKYIMSEEIIGSNTKCGAFLARACMIPII